MSETPPASMVLNFDDLDTKRRFMAKVGKLSGLQEITIKPRRKTRSLNQNSYYWVAVVSPFREWLREEWQEEVSLEQAHEMLKHKILGTKEIVDKTTGEALEIPPTSHDLDSFEFGQFIEGAARWLAEFTGIVVLPSEMFFEGQTEGKRT